MDMTGTKSKAYLEAEAKLPGDLKPIFGQMVAEYRCAQR